MLNITIPAKEYYDETKDEFITIMKEQTLCLEHSLISLSKWEAKWHKPFLAKDAKTEEESRDYIKCMTITQNVSSDIYEHLTSSNLEQIYKYINDPMTATRIPKDDKNKINNEIVTSELIYYWMIELRIPVEFQKWHLNRLITLIKTCNFKNQPKKKRSGRDIMSHNTAMNAKRRAQLNSKG